MKSLANIPPEATDALSILTHRLGPSLRAAYLHGSFVGQGLRKRSDVDLLAVIEGPLPVSARAPLLADLMAVSGLYPIDPLGRRPLEVTIFQLADLAPLAFPARAEFVYGEWLRDAFASGSVPQVETSPEFTLLLAQARREAMPVIGPNLADLVTDIPADTIRRAIGDLLPGLVSSLVGDERNVLLTLARMWVTLATCQFVSKETAANWAGPQLSQHGSDVLLIARDAYLGSREDNLHQYRTEVSAAAEELRGHIVAELRKIS